MTEGRTSVTSGEDKPAPERYLKNSHCSYCGHPFVAGSSWPRLCTACGNLSFANPIPVVIVLVPVDDGVLVVRRRQEPGRGILALPGGYVELGENWQEASARELREEAGVLIDPDTVREFRVFSAPDDTIIICGRVPAQSSKKLPPFRPTEEVSERRILTEPEELAFPLHTEIVEAFLAGRSQAT